jgi:Ca-activated chloride channel homolog
MSDPLDEISLLLKNAQSLPHDKIKENQAIELAMEKFDQKNALSSQGNGMRLRLIYRAWTMLNPNKGVFMKKSYMAAGGLCAATLVIALLNTSILNNEFINLQNATKLQDIAAVQSEKALPRMQLASPLTAAPMMASGDKAIMRSDMVESDSSSRISADRIDSNVIMQESLENVIQPSYHDEGRNKFEHVKDNPVKLTKEEPVSTFSIDVDTASYSFIRASLNNNVLPQKDSVRIEEMVNYFPYDYALPKEKNEPFAPSVTIMPTPWNNRTKLIHIGIKGYDIPKAQKPHSNLVFLIDTSGSMSEPNKLPLLKNSMKMLLESLQPDDTVAIVTYAGSAGVALEPTKAADKQKIISTIDSFGANGATAGAEGIRQAYDLAERNFDKNGVNRVILATDGDFNVGITDQNELKSFIERKRDSGVFLSVIGFGQGNYNDAMMQTLAQNGNGNAAYIDNLNEARKVLVEESVSTLFAIAKDVKIQVEFNPEVVAEYRLIGYETRMLRREDFNNDKIDAGEIGAGHSVTAIYEITPTGSDAKLIDDLRYGKNKKTLTKSENKNSEYGFLKIRYKLPKEEASKLINTPIDLKLEVGGIDKASVDVRFATSVAAFGQLLRGEGMTKNFTYDDVASLAESGKGADKFGYRAEFINLVRLAKSASGLEPLQNGQHIPAHIIKPTSLE